MKNVDFISEYLSETSTIANQININDVQEVAKILVNTKKNDGRLFILGVGGSSSAASHAVNDFRKICGIETYCPTDNVAELTARTNDSGWETVFSEWLKVNKLKSEDTVLVLSVGGGDYNRNISVNLIHAINYAFERFSKVVGIVGRDGGYVRRRADASVIIPPLVIERITPHTEEFHAVILHLLATHPELKEYETTWESEGKK